VHQERQSVFKQLGCFYGYLKQCPLDSLLSLRMASCAASLEVSALCQQHGRWSDDLMVLGRQIWSHDAPVELMYSPEKLVYLSPDADEVLEQLDPSRIYVVGAIADRTVRKVRASSLLCSAVINPAILTRIHLQGETAAKAKSKGLRTVRLPVREHLATARTHVLNIDAVLVALNEFANHRDWSRAFACAVPKRIATGRRVKKSTSLDSNVFK
jgi:hypothetical protein